jgi:hypothetical protein
MASWHVRVSYALSTAGQCMFTCTRGGGDAFDFLSGRDLVEQVRCVTDLVFGDFNSSDFQCLLGDSGIDLAPDPRV